MVHDENVHDIASMGNEPVNEKSASDSVRDEKVDAFILEGDLSGSQAHRSPDGETELKTEESGKDEMTVDVVETVTRLEELDRLLGELNFRELIMQFGKVQGDLELIRYELDALRNESTRVHEILTRTDYLRSRDITAPMEIIGEFRERIYALTDGVRKLISQQEILISYARSSRGWLLERSGEALEALTRIREAQRSRMEMVASLNQMLESDTPNEKLASAALEFAVLMRELDGDEGLEKLDSVISDMGGFRDEVEQAESIVLEDSPRLEDMKEDLGLVEEVPGITGELLSFLATVSRTLDKIETGWNGQENSENTIQEEMPPAESDE